MHCQGAYALSSAAMSVCHLWRPLNLAAIYCCFCRFSGSAQGSMVESFIPVRTVHPPQKPLTQVAHS